MQIKILKGIIDMAKNPKIIAIEEHFMHKPLTDHFNSKGHQPEKIRSRLFMILWKLELRKWMQPE